VFDCTEALKNKVENLAVKLQNASAFIVE
jgi:hypothetical protein